MPLLIQSLHEVGFCVSISKAVQTNKPLPARWTDGGMLDIRAALDRIAMPTQGFQKHIIGQASGQRRIYVMPDEITDGCFSVPFGVPLGIMLALSVGINDRKTVLLTYGVRRIAQIVKVAFEIAAILSAIHERNRIENNVAMQVVAVGVRTDNGFVFVS